MWEPQWKVISFMLNENVGLCCGDMYELMEEEAMQLESGNITNTCKEEE